MDPIQSTICIRTFQDHLARIARASKFELLNFISTAVGRAQAVSRSADGRPTRKYKVAFRELRNASQNAKSICTVRHLVSVTDLGGRFFRKCFHNDKERKTNQILLFRRPADGREQAERKPNSRKFRLFCFRYRYENFSENWLPQICYRSSMSNSTYTFRIL